MSWTQDLVIAAHAGHTVESREALCNRGVTDEQIDAFQLGYLRGGRLPDGIEYPERFRAWWGNHRSQFRNPLVFPLTNTLGAVHGLQFRDVKEEIRGYLDYFEVKEEPAFFGLMQAMPSVWSTQAVWLVEGAFDLFPLQRHMPNVISTIHAGVSSALRRVLRRIAKTLLVAYDSDATGRKVSYEMVRELRDDFEIKVISFPRLPRPQGGLTKDPNELWKLWGDATLGAFLHRCA